MRTPYVVTSDNCAFFDVDDTLILCNKDTQVGIPIPLCVTIDYFGKSWTLYPHARHIQELKNHAFRKHKVVVWSAGGYEWAEVVVKALGLEEYVDLIMSKPKWIYDDLPLTELATHIYKEPT